jgi:16S rRNA (guanine(1405)-N(7))-methyltransferase
VDVANAVNAASAAPAQGAAAGAVLASRRYRWLAPEFVARVAAREAARAPGQVEAVKRTKRKLHQVFGAYLDELRPAPVIAALRAAAAQDAPALAETCRRLMAQHASTRERLPVLDRFYAEVFAVTGRPETVVDLACGLGPLALPWLALGQDARYFACDVDARLVEIAAACLAANRLGGAACLLDVAQRLPNVRADVALLLKAVPCLEQQAPGSAAQVLGGVDARHVVVSSPTRSLGGARKGMVAHYRALMAQLSAGREWSIQELLFPAELVFVVDKDAGGERHRALALPGLAGQ